MTLPMLIAHRGDTTRHPENTIPALEAAMVAGAPCVEFDVQVTRDGVPVVLHDATLERTAGLARDVREMSYADIREVSVCEAARLGRSHYVPLPSLADVVDTLRDWPRVTAFVEIKGESSLHFGVEQVTRLVREAIEPIVERSVVIAFEAATVRAAQRMGAARTGWCLERMDRASRGVAEALNPEVLLFGWQEVPDTGLWTGRWQWALWEVTDPALALTWHGRGAHYIETMAAGAMLSHRSLSRAKLR